MPQVAQAVQPRLPKLYDVYFDNGVQLLGTQTRETPTVLIEIQLPAGERQVAMGKEGLANLTASLLQEGSQTVAPKPFKRNWISSAQAFKSWREPIQPALWYRV